VVGAGVVPDAQDVVDVVVVAADAAAEALTFAGSDGRDASPGRLLSRCEEAS